ncbi:hypothetical protein J1605_014410 [Eschrichtius robustus]|uniref:Uncharacterized protein n=1 Tax=Eschrichtius robustus TaxID=9764 RepID=A0AB34GFH3_ESCRO|nr:hypothetical protein J1605_014410 [Eschrichtius robustus]
MRLPGPSGRRPLLLVLLLALLAAAAAAASAAGPSPIQAVEVAVIPGRPAGPIAQEEPLLQRWVLVGEAAGSPSSAEATAAPRAGGPGIAEKEAPTARPCRPVPGDPGVRQREVSPGQDQTLARGADPRGWGREAKRPGSPLPAEEGGAVPAEKAAELAQTTKAIVPVGACLVTECPKLRSG